MPLRVTGLPVSPGSRPTVILVDDDPAVANAVQFSFDLEGLDVRNFRDAESLLAYTSLPDKGCLVIDYQLPGVDGLDLLDRLRENGVLMPAVLITTNPRPHLRARAAAAGVPIIEKPLLTDGLLSAVHSALAHSDQP